MEGILPPCRRIVAPDCCFRCGLGGRCLWMHATLQPAINGKKRAGSFVSHLILGLASMSPTDQTDQLEQHVPWLRGAQ